MHGVALTVMLMAGTYGDCIHGDCGQCYPPCKGFADVWYEFWCNVSVHDDARMTRQYWPLEYPGARARGQQAHGLAPTRDEARQPIGLGSPVLMDEDGNLVQECDECTGEDFITSEHIEEEVFIPEVSQKPKPKKRTATKSILSRKRR